MTLASGLCTRDLSDEANLPDKIVGTRAKGFDHCHISSFPEEADDSGLDTIRTIAEDAGITLSVGIGQVNPSRPHTAAAALTLGKGDLKHGLMRLLDRCKKLGSAQAHFTIGTMEDRGAMDIPWPEQLRRTEDLLQDVAAHAADLDIDLALKTHEEMTTSELDNLLRNVGSTHLGAAFSPVNTLLRLEHPIRALHRLAPHLKAVMVDDAVLHWNHRGIQRVLVPFGHGDVPWPEILATVSAGRADKTTPVILDIHRAAIETPAFEAASDAKHTDSKPRELAELLGLVRAGRATAPHPLESRFNEGCQGVLGAIGAIQPATVA